LTFTPMIHSVIFNTHDKYRDKCLRDISPLDKPLFIQFCGHDPEMLLAAGKFVENKCESMDINLGCPQGIAKKGFYGSYLLEDTELVLKIAGYLANNLKCGVSCKIRLFPDLDRTMDLVRNLEKTGIKVLTVHGRTKEQNKVTTGEADWRAIKMIKDNISIPLIANGGIQNFDDVDRIFEETGCDAVMSSEKLLEYPPIFTKKLYDLDDVALEYLDICKEVGCDLAFVRGHLFKFYYQACQMEPKYNQKLVNINDLDEYIQLGQEIKELRKDVPLEDKLCWYMRYRKAEEKKLAEDTEAQIYDMSDFFN
jgi:tRNA-dihydrouridine synthase 1